MHNLSAKRGRPVVLALGAFLITVPAVGASTHGGDSLGVVHFPVACSPTVQAKFDRAVALLHNFVIPDTVRAFTAIIQEDPTCAMGYWGLAMSQRGNPLIPPFDPAALKRGWDAVQQGVATKPKSAREREYLAAVEAQYRDFDKVDQQMRSRAYADAMGRLHEHYPDDSEAAIFYALALNEAADLGDGAFTNQLKAVAILQMEAKRQPDHPGIAHYLIHSYDFAPLAALCLPIARRYSELAPAAPHAQHMPSHIYSMLGMWDDSIAANLVAEAAAREQAAVNFPGKDHPSLPHGMDFRIVGYLQMGQDRQAKQVVEQLHGMNPALSQLPIDTSKQAVPARYAIDRGQMG